MEHKPQDAPVAWRELFTRTHAPALALVGMGVWLHAADSLLVATMMPAMVADLGGAALVAWTVALYEVGSIVAGVSSGLAAVRYGIRGPMAFSALLFAAGCAVGTLATRMEVVLVGRLFQGLGGGGLVALSFVAAGMLFPRRLAARVMAVVSTLWGVSAFLGPLVGALFVSHGTWRWGFGFFAVQAVTLGGWILSRRVDGAVRRDASGGRRLPLARMLLVAAGVVLVARGGLVSDEGAVAFSLAAGLACIAGFFHVDRRRVDTRLMPRLAVDPRTRTGSALAMVLCFSIATIALGTYGPLLLTMVHGTPMLTAGYVLAVESVGWSVAAVAVSGASERRDPGFIAAGMMLVTASTAGLAVVVPAGPVWMVGVFSAVAGGGFGMAWTFILRRVTCAVPAGERERVAAAFPTTQRLGYALGAALIGIVANGAGMADAGDAEAARVVARWVFAACIPFAVAGLAAAARFVTVPPDDDDA